MLQTATEVNLVAVDVELESGIEQEAQAMSVLPEALLACIGGGGMAADY